MNLSNFEKSIDTIILLRGQDIFNKKNLIEIPQEVGKNKYKTIVYGSDDYDIFVELDENNTIKKSKCDCPFDKGPICKHQVAVFYTLRKLLNVDLEIITNKKLKNKVKVEEKNNKQYFKKLIMNSFNQASGRYGYVNWDRTYDSLEGAEEVISILDDFIVEKNYETATIALSTLIETLIDNLQNVDDSDGSYGDIISGICVGEYLPLLIGEIINNGTNKDREFFIDEFIKLVSNKNIFGYDFEKEILENMFLIIDNKVDAIKIYNIIEILDKDNEFYNYKVQKYKIISNFFNDKLNDFLLENKYCFDLQSYRIDEFINDEKFLEAFDLLTMFYEYDKKNNRFHISILERLLIVSNKLNKIDLVRKYSFEIFENNPAKINYLNYKKLFNLQEFNLNIVNIFNEFEKYPKIINHYEFPEICLEEKFEQKFIDYFLRNPYISKVDRYFTKLLKLIPDELYVIYKNEVLNVLKTVTGRNIYKEQCRIIRKMFKIKENETKIFIQELLSMYKQRKALIEELNNLGLK